MLQFSESEMQVIIERASASMIETLKNNNDVVLNHDTLVPETGIATWNLYYFCPEHGVRLTWDRYKPKSHCCPVDGKEFTGQPYDGAWWRWLNGLNAKACYDLGLLWQLTGDNLYLDKVTGILLEYAKYYPDYEEHGGIPYNGPGKANAQTLCEANCHLDFARGYDFVKDQLSAEQQQYVEDRLLREGAEFLMKHRTAQLHNHEMKINATVGVIGLILDEQSYIDFALNTEYGIHYQLDHGCTNEGMWFEGSIHYHYYALQALLNFEKIACNTPYSVSSNANFLKMLKFPLSLVLNNDEFPRLNDSIDGQQKLTHAHLFEFAQRQYPCELFARTLASIYQNISRDNIEALLYGVDELPLAKPLVCQPIHAEEAGITLEFDAKNDNALLYKHAPYGGEHDHYDRLGIIVTRQGKEILPDLGTTGYGAELHYGYYKNTATHNTLAVNQKNQSPINPVLNHYLQGDTATVIDAEVDWSQEEASVDSHTIVQWDSSSYQNVKYRRVLIWLDNLLVELHKIDNPNQQQLDLTYHVRGTHKHAQTMSAIENPLQGPLARMTETRLSAQAQSHTLTYGIEDQADYSQHIWSNEACQVLTGYAPDNPAVSDLAYSLVRSTAVTFNAVVLHDLSDEQAVSVELIEWKQDSVSCTFVKDGKQQTLSYDLASHALDHL
ncbi:heparinase II/III domain-containing protein [Vibrio breoganii]|uniref:heparinase II/III domain-containing protein n=1 Tax=Vibrio breoganii TaxID=553239 RepID=UPI000C867913|nr:heparinase II/III family protein [Vibrio breoganii]PMH17389.1 alginate lyase [Vibrio breoganii]PMM13494.1 alginate lyase [Vibrio breoganii]